LTVAVTQGIDLRLPRTWHSATRLYDGRILLAGGSNGMDDHYAVVEIFDPVSGLLTPAASLHTPRHEHSATLLLDGRVLVVGGYNRSRQWLVDAEVYNPSANTWTVVPPIYSHGVQHTATLLQDGRVLVVGGCIGSSVCTNRVEIFDPQTNSWTEATPLGFDRASHAAVLLDDGRVLVAGGAVADGDALVYDPLVNTWIATGPMVSQRTQAPMIKLFDGRVLVAGGLDISDYPIASTSTEIYDPATNTWTAAASLSQPRYAHIVALLPDGQVLAVGGAREYDYPYNYPYGHPWTAFSFIRNIESYDSRSDCWHIAGELPQPLTYAAAAFLPDGRLWMTGGGASHDIATAWADTWLIASMPTPSKQPSFPTKTETASPQIVQASPVVPAPTFAPAPTVVPAPTFAPAPTAAPAPVPVTPIANDALLVWYDFEGDFLTSGIIADRSGNGFDAQVNGTVEVAAGISGGQAVFFSGNGYALAQSNPVAGRNTVSFSLWFKTDHPDANYKLASAAWWNGGPGSGWILATHIPEFWSEDTNGLYLPGLSNNDNHFPVGEWVHEVVTYDGQRILEYTNGQLVNDWPTTGAAIGQGQAMALGAWPSFSAYNYQGSMDEFQVFARSLTQPEVQALYGQGR
jgi:N-acetylneuraminic acid mutarotase